jgi:hypothetical protein
MVMGYHQGGKIACFSYDYHKRKANKTENGRKVFFKGSEMPVVENGLEKRAREMIAQRRYAEECALRAEAAALREYIREVITDNI